MYKTTKRNQQRIREALHYLANERKCNNCISGWERKDNLIKCTNPDSPDYRKTINGENVCDLHEFP